MYRDDVVEVFGFMVLSIRLLGGILFFYGFEGVFISRL